MRFTLLGGYHPQYVSSGEDIFSSDDSDIFCWTKEQWEKEPKRALRVIILQSNGSWIIISQVTNPNIAR